MPLPPGPRSPALVQTLQYMRRPAESLRENARRYGNLWTRRNLVWGNEVVVSEPELLKQIFTGDSAVFHAGEVNAPGSIIVGQSVFVLDGAPHLRRRRLLLPPFHGERMHAYGPAMHQAAKEAIAQWRDGSEVALLPAMQRVTMDIILRTVFGLGDGPRRDELRTRLGAMVDKVQSATGLFLVLPLFQRELGGLLPWATFIKERARADALIYAEIAERRKALATPEGARLNDVLSLLLAATDEDGAPMTDLALRDELMTLLVAGYETTATALCWAVERILGHPEVFARLLAELEGVSPEKAADLPYLDATIKESHRTRPVVPILGRKTKAPIKLGGYDIPAETHVFPAVYLTHHRPDLYPDPDTFQPERFLGKKVDPYTWFPFGGGVRRCIGMAFALYEMKIVLATMLSSRRLRLARPAPLDVVLRGFSFAPRGGTRVVIEGPR